jgi:hypothetical protein
MMEAKRCWGRALVYCSGYPPAQSFCSTPAVSAAEVGGADNDVLCCGTVDRQSCTGEQRTLGLTLTRQCLLRLLITANPRSQVVQTNAVDTNGVSKAFVSKADDTHASLSCG